jgi:hypothetical protein
MRLFTLACLVALYVGPHAFVRAQQTLDTRFGDRGALRLDFSAQSGAVHSHDDGTVACASPDGVLMSVGIANEEDLVVAWIGDRGRPATRFGSQGRALTTLADRALGQEAFAITGACLGDGSALLAYYTGTGTRLIRVAHADGRPDPHFGVAGYRDLDLQPFSDVVLVGVYPLTINLASDGDILLSGAYRHAGDAGFVARLDPDGSVRAAALSHRFDAQIRRFVAAGDAADGTTWGAAVRSDGSAVLRLGRSDLAFVDRLPVAPSAHLDPGRGVMLDGTHFALVGVYATPDGDYGSRARLSIVGATTRRELDLPLRAAERITDVQVAATGSQRLVVAGSYTGNERGAFITAILRAGDGVLTLDDRLGAGGTLRIPLSIPRGCAPSTGRFLFGRFTLWRGRPTLIGTSDIFCPDGEPYPTDDFQLYRLDRDLLLADGFE